MPTATEILSTPAPAASAAPATVAPTPKPGEAAAPQPSPAPQTTTAPASPATLTPMAEPVKTEAAEGTRLASQFAALSRKDRETQKTIEQWKPVIAEAKAFADAKKELSTSGGVLKALDLLGVTYEQLTNAMIGKSQKPKSETELAELKARLDANEKAASERDASEKKAQADATINEFKESISEFVSTNAAKYELIKESQSENLVFEVIELAYKQSVEAGRPSILSIDEACQRVEAHLDAQVAKIVTLNKVKSRMNPTPPAPAKPEPTKTETPTLTNADANATKMVRTRELSDSEAIAEAAKHLKFL